MSAALPIICILLVVVTATSVKVCQESERLAISRLGRMMPLRGPGLILLVPNIDRGIKIKSGDRAEVVDNESARIRGISFPISNTQKLTGGTPVRIVGFEGGHLDGKARVEPDTDARREIRCERCGNIMQV